MHIFCSCSAKRMFGGLCTKTRILASRSWSCTERCIALSAYYERKRTKPLWEQEYDKLYGPKLTKKQVEKVIESTKDKYAIKSEIETFESYADKLTEQIAQEQREAKKKRTKKTKKQVESQGETTDDEPKDISSSLDKLLMFPLFEPPSDSSFQVQDFDNLAHKDIIAGPLQGYVPSVSKIINESMPPESRHFLDRWEEEMIEKLGIEGFKQYKRGMN